MRRRSRHGSRQSGRRRPKSRWDRLGRTASSSLSTPSSGMNCSTEKSFTRLRRRRSSSRVGGAITTPCARTDRSDTSLQPRRSLCLPWPRGQLRNPGQLRRPRWRRGRQRTNIPAGPLSGGRSVRVLQPDPNRRSPVTTDQLHHGWGHDRDHRAPLSIERLPPSGHASANCAVQAGALLALPVILDHF